jgi:hypothetical protein
MGYINGYYQYLQTATARPGIPRLTLETPYARVWLEIFSERAVETLHDIAEAGHLVLTVRR